MARAGLLAMCLSSCSPLWLEPFSTDHTTSATHTNESGLASTNQGGSQDGSDTIGDTNVPTTTLGSEGTSGAGTTGTSGGDASLGGVQTASSATSAGGTETAASADTGSTTCASETAGCEPDGPSVCNNGVREPGEACDGLDLDGEGCGSLGWDGGELACSPACSFDTSGCTGPPMCEYALQPEAPNTSQAAPYDCPGGVVMPISGTIDKNTGMLTVSSPGKPNDYGPGTYRVVVFSPGDVASNQCKSFNVVKTKKVLATSATSITFPAFDSLLTCGAQKAYCIEKEAGGNPAHFCSGILLATDL